MYRAIAIVSVISMGIGLSVAMVRTNRVKPAATSDNVPAKAPRREDGRATVEDRLRECGAEARQRMRPGFDRTGVAYPPARLCLVGLKEEKRLEVWAGAAECPMKLVRTYPILAASGSAGPKLRQGDRQVPEGIYAIESLNPNSRYHLSLRVNYPNAFDRETARREGRTNLGGDIMIHGKAASIGCLAMGDEAAEELFVLAADTGVAKIKVILCPVDFRVREVNTSASRPAWMTELYSRIRRELGELAQ